MRSELKKAGAALSSDEKIKNNYSRIIRKADQINTLIKEKFKRGNNTKNTEGAGLGLYISDFFMKEMHGNLLVENGSNGLLVTVMIPLSGAASAVDL